MDKKKIFGIPLLIGVVAIIVLLAIDSDPKAGNKFEAKVLAPEAIKADSLKAVKLYVDFSGSMKGYIDFAGVESGKNTLISTVSSMLDNIESSYGVVSESKCGDKTYTKDQLRLAMQNKSIFNAKTTSVQDMIHIARSYANKNSLSIVVSDMVMSWGLNKIKESKDTLYNLTQIDGLGAAIHSEMMAVKNAGLDVMLIQYYSDFNGRYYYNFTENLKSPDLYKNKKMEKRPYYILMIGDEKQLKELVLNNCVKEFENIYTSFNVEECSKIVKYDIEAKDGDKSAKLWTIGNSNSPDEIGAIWTTDNLESSTSTFTFLCSELNIPNYCYTANKMLYTESTPDVINKSVVNYPDFNMDITLKPFNELPDNQEIEVRVICPNSWAKDASTLDDIKEKDMSGKTWGLEKIIEKIDNAYYPKGRNNNQVVGVFRFRIQK